MSLDSNIGPSLQEHLYPSLVFTTQLKQATTPQAIHLSRDIQQSIFRSAAKSATAFNIGSGPQAYIAVFSAASSVSCSNSFVTIPFSPFVPSSVVILRVMLSTSRSSGRQTRSSWDFVP